MQTTTAKPLEGRVAIVTGSGMGAAKGIAVGLARAGARVVTNNRKPGSVGLSSWMNKDETEELLTDEDRRLIESMSGDARTTADQINAEGGEAIAFFGDPGDVATAGELVEAAIATWGRLDILVNGAAGSAGFGPFSKLSPEDWHHQTHAKLTGTYNTMHHALPHMKRQRFGRVLNAASDAWVGMPMLAAYSAANAGVVALTKAVAAEVQSTGITCNAFCPRSISRNHVNWRATMRRQLSKLTGPDADLIRRQIEVEDAEHQEPEKLAPFLAYLSTAEAAAINGSVFTVTAGGRIGIWSEAAQIAEITRPDGNWSIAELAVAVPEGLLGRDSTAAVQPTRPIGFEA